MESSLYLGTATQMVVRLAGDTSMTVLVPNTDEAARQRLPGRGRRRAPDLVRPDSTSLGTADAAAEGAHARWRHEVSEIETGAVRAADRDAADPPPHAPRGAGGALGVVRAGSSPPAADERGGNGPKAARRSDREGQDRREHVLLELAAYIDENQPALKNFQKKYGTKVKYVEEINDNDQFFGKVRQQYAKGDSGGRDLP